MKSRGIKWGERGLVVVASEEVESSVLPRGDEQLLVTWHLLPCVSDPPIIPPVTHYAFPNSNCETEA